MSLFADLTVLSLEQATTLPFLTQRLAREGMRVIRLEPPGRGDPNRYVGQDVLGEAAMASYFLPNNCGKQAVTLNLADPAGQALLHDLIAALPVDIFATNNRPSSYEKLGIDYGMLRSVRPDLIWLGITGYGPQSNIAAYDPVIQAQAGLMELTGERDGPPYIFGLPIVDLGAAEHAYGAVLKALYRRARTGEGSRIDISMFRSALSWMANPLMLTALGEHITRNGNTHRFFAPASVYPTLDGYVYIAVGNDRQWQALTELAEFADLAQPEYERNAGRIADVGRLHARLAAATRNWNTADLMTALNPRGIPVAKVHSLQDVVGDPLVCEALLRVNDERTGTEVLLPPVAEVGAGQPPDLAFPPRLGEHNQPIYGQVLGYDAKKLGELQQAGVI